jgi:prophage DNA circulation protein
MAAKPKGSFRGVSFATQSHRTIVGRRQPTHALPFQEKGSVAVDLGRSPRKFEMTVFVVGPGYRAERDALIEALETKGPGILIHPEHGRVNVTVGPDIPVSESTEEGGKATISFRAEEHFDQPKQTTSLDTASALKASAKKGRLAARDSFTNPLTGLKTLVSDVVAATQLEVLDNVLNDMRAVNGMVSSVLAAPGALAAKIDDISRNAALLLDTPGRLFDAIDGALETIGNACRRIFGPGGVDIDQADAVDVASLPLRRGKTLSRAVGPVAGLGASSPAIPDIDTQDRRDEADSQRALQRHFQGAGLFNLANAVADTPFDSADEAIQVRDALAGALANLSEAEPDLDAPLATALKQCAGLVMQHLTAVAGPLPTIAHYTPADTLPAEVIAYQLYGDADRADDILIRNPSIKHPGLIAGKVEIEVESP